MQHKGGRVRKQDNCNCSFVVPISAVTCTIAGLLLCFISKRIADVQSQRLIDMLDSGTTDFRVLCTISLAAFIMASILSAVLVCGGSYMYLQQRNGAGTHAGLYWAGSLYIVLGLCVACSAVMLTASSMTAAMDHTLSVALHRASAVYTTAEAALTEGQAELEHRLKTPPQGLQDMLSEAKSSMPLPPLPLPPPPDPVQQALGAFADAALGKYIRPAMDGVQKAMKDRVETEAADLTKDNAALAALVAQLEKLQDARPGAGEGVCPAQCLDLRQYPVLHSAACVCAHQALGHMHRLALHARAMSAAAIAGACLQLAGFVWLLVLAALWMGRSHTSYSQPVQCTYEQVPLNKVVRAAFQESGSEEELIHASLEMTQQGGKLGQGNVEASCTTDKIYV